MIKPLFKLFASFGLMLSLPTLSLASDLWCQKNYKLFNARSRVELYAICKGKVMTSLKVIDSARSIEMILPIQRGHMTGMVTMKRCPQKTCTLAIEYPIKNGIIHGIMKVQSSEKVKLTTVSFKDGLRDGVSDYHLADGSKLSAKYKAGIVTTTASREKILSMPNLSSYFRIFENLLNYRTLKRFHIKGVYSTKQRYDWRGFKVSNEAKSFYWRYSYGAIYQRFPINNNGISTFYKDGYATKETWKQTKQLTQVRTIGASGFGPWITPPKPKQTYSRNVQPLIVAGLGGSTKGHWNADLHLLAGNNSDGAAGGAGVTLSRVATDTYSVEGSVGMSAYYALAYLGAGVRFAKQKKAAIQVTAGVGFAFPIIYLRVIAPTATSNADIELGLSIKLPLFI